MLVSLDYKEVKVGNDDVTVEIKPLSVGAYQDILKILHGIISKSSGSNLSEEEVRDLGIAQMSNPELIEVCKKTFPEHVRNLKGIQLQENGEVRDATIEDLFRYGALIDYCISILTTLFQESNLSKKEEKDLKKQ